MELINGQPQNHTYSPDSSAPEIRTCLQGQKQKHALLPVGSGAGFLTSYDKIYLIRLCTSSLIREHCAPRCPGTRYSCTGKALPRLNKKTNVQRAGARYAPVPPRSHTRKRRRRRMPPRAACASSSPPSRAAATPVRPWNGMNCESCASQ